MPEDATVDDVRNAICERRNTRARFLLRFCGADLEPNTPLSEIGANFDEGDTLTMHPERSHALGRTTSAERPRGGWSIPDRDIDMSAVVDPDNFDDLVRQVMSVGVAGQDTEEGAKDALRRMNFDVNQAVMRLVWLSGQKGQRVTSIVTPTQKEREMVQSMVDESGEAFESCWSTYLEMNRDEEATRQALKK